MKCNIGTTDKIVRVITGLIVIAVGCYLNTWWGLIGLLPIFTSIIGWCGLYTLLGISTCKIKGGLQ